MTMGKLFYSNRESEVMHIFEAETGGVGRKPVEQPNFYGMERKHRQKRVRYRY